MKVTQISAMVLSAFAVVGVVGAIVAPSAGATSSSSSMTTSASKCADLNDINKVKVHWADTANKPGTVTVSSNGMPACADTTLWFSSFTLPKNYDNSGVFGADHPTSYPQKGVAHTKISVKAGQVLNGTYTVTEPNRCETATQFDVYNRSSAVTSISTAKGVLEPGDTKWAWGFVVTKLAASDAACKGAETPKTPTTPKTTTPTPTKTIETKTSAPAPTPTAVKQAVETPAVQTAQTVNELPHTGLEMLFAPVFGTGAAAAATAYAVRRFRK